jgi:hypothetical protein
MRKRPVKITTRERKGPK